MSNRKNGSNGRGRPRLDFAKIETTIQIPNLIEVQRRSYHRFLQMDRLPAEREDFGLQSVFTSVFPILDFRGLSQLDFVDYSIGNWECKCGNLKGLNHLRTPCRSCGTSLRTDPKRTGPYAADARIVATPIECSPCFRRPCWHHSCMIQLEVQTVLKQVAALRPQAEITA